MIQEALAQRKLPELMRFSNGKKVATPEDWRKRREEILALLRREIYGFSPEPPEAVRGVVMGAKRDIFAGKADQSLISVEFGTPRGSFCFEVTMIVPKRVKKPPVFLHISFRSNGQIDPVPYEELVDNGYAVASFCYEDISPDRDDGFMTGLPAAYPRDAKTGWGKLSVWAWAASRVMDYLCTSTDIDCSSWTFPAGENRFMVRRPGRTIFPWDL